MIAAHIRYTMKADYVEQNKAHINQVMKELRALDRTDIRYSVFVEDDGRTFNHLPVYANEGAREAFVALESFKVFQAGVHNDFLEEPPVVTNFSLVGSSTNLPG